MIATAWLLFPYKQILVKLVMRIVVVVILGPQNRIVDEIWIRPYYRTNEDLLRDGIPATTEEMKVDIGSRPNILDQILVSKWVYDMGKSGRIVVEENLKLQAAREVHKKTSIVLSRKSMTFISISCRTARFGPLCQARSCKETYFLILL